MASSGNMVIVCFYTNKVYESSEKPLQYLEQLETCELRFLKIKLLNQHIIIS